MDKLKRAWQFARRELRGRGTVRQRRTKWSSGPFRVTSAASLGERRVDLA